MKLYIYATEIDKVLLGNFDWSLTVSTRDDLEDATKSGWLLVGSVDADIEIDREKMTATAIQIIEAEKEQVRAEMADKLGLLEMKKSELLAITYQGDEDEPS